jgi:hypothetical protein
MADMKPRIGFSSVLGNEYLDDLEKLLFFNPQQERTLSGINQSIQEYGVPHVLHENGRLRIRLQGLQDVQALFALEDSPDQPQLVGVMVFHRVEPEAVVLLHIAVKEEYSRFGSRADAHLVGKMMAELRAIARKLKGVRSIHLKYARGLVFPV